MSRLFPFVPAVALLLSTGSLAANEQPLSATAAPQSAEGLVFTPPPAGVARPMLPAADAAVADQLRNLIENKIDQHVARTDDRAAVEAFYRGRDFAPLWIADGALNARAKGAIAALSDAAADGLDPADYPAPELVNAEPAVQAAGELLLTSSILKFVRHARTGRVSFTRVSASMYFDLQFPDPAAVLAAMADTADVRAALDAFEPQHTAYHALKKSLADARSSGDPRKVDAILANMERWRWLPHDLGATYVMVNVPDYTLKVVNEGKTVWQTRIVVGKPGDMKTPLLSETMKYITVNPTWNVPPSIIRNEYLPALQRNPGALARQGLKLTHNPDGSLRIYQPPGERNALGRLRFNFPNRFLVYQHDTPTKHLFANQERAYSHGCMRVQNPEQYAQVLLSISQPEDGYTAERIRKLYGANERTIKLKREIPVYITYQTAFIDDAGQLQTRTDVYGHDKAIANLLSNQRRVADVPVQRNYSAGSKPVMSRLPAARNAFASATAGDQRAARWQGEYSGGWSYSQRERQMPW